MDSHNADLHRKTLITFTYVSSVFHLVLLSLWKKEATDQKESKGGYIRGFGGKKAKGEMM